MSEQMLSKIDPYSFKRQELRLFFHTVFTSQMDGVTDALGDLSQYLPLTAPQSPKVKHDLHTEQTFYPLADLILAEVENIGRNLFEYKDDYGYEITQMWMNSLKPGQGHHIHTHHNTLWSGVFYLNGENGEFPPINFENPFYRHFVLTYDKLNEYNCNNWQVPNKKDSLVLFPSYLRHWVNENNSPNNRMSISFNIMLRGRYEDESSLQSVEI